MNNKFLDKLTGFIEYKVSPPLVKLSQVRYLVALQKAFLTLMPYMILGATATLVLNLGGLFAEGTGLNMPQVADAINSVVSVIRLPLLQLVFVSINLLALIVCILNGYYLGEHYSLKNDKISPMMTGLVAMVSFLCFIDFGALSANFDWPNYVLGSPSIFGAIIISIIAVELYRWFIEKNITIKMPDGVPPMIASAFTSNIPVCCILILMAFVGRGIEGFDFLSIFNNIFSYLVVGGSGWVAQFLAFILDRLLWFVGLHGSNIVGSVMQPIWTTMITENIAAFSSQQAIPFMFTEQWINNYVRLSVFPIALLCVMSKVKRYKVLGKLSLPGTIFNIAEPIMYGLPIVLNPLMFVPWVLGFAALFLFNVVLAYLGLTPTMVAMTVWTMPAPLAAFIGSGFNFWALILSLINFVIIFVIFYPFFKVMEKQELENEKTEYIEETTCNTLEN